jgi:hypothetical protein
MNKDPRNSWIWNNKTHWSDSAIIPSRTGLSRPTSNTVPIADVVLEPLAPPSFKPTECLFDDPDALV